MFPRFRQTILEKNSIIVLYSWLCNNKNYPILIYYADNPRHLGYFKNGTI